MDRVSSNLFGLPFIGFTPYRRSSKIDGRMTWPPCLSFVIDDRVSRFRKSFAASFVFRSVSGRRGGVGAPVAQGMVNLDSHSRRPLFRRSKEVDVSTVNPSRSIQACGHYRIPVFWERTS